MKKILAIFITMGLMLLTLSCGNDEPAPNPEPEPTPTPTPNPSDDPIDPNAIYNGIVLPAQWPPQRNYASEIRSGMNPFYLSSKPAVVKIDVGRQLLSTIS